MRFESNQRCIFSNSGIETIISKFNAASSLVIHSHVALQDNCMATQSAAQKTLTSIQRVDSLICPILVDLVQYSASFNYIYFCYVALYWVPQKKTPPLYVMNF